MTTSNGSLISKAVPVSVVIPLYNKVVEIRRAIDSVLAQTYVNFQLIVVDDGSTDGSGDVVRQVPDPRIRLITQANAGEGAARNTGILVANAEFVAFLDADDEWLPDFLQTVMGLQARYPTAGMYATAYCLCEEGKIRRPAFLHCVAPPEDGLLEDYFRAALGPAPVWSSAVMIPKRVLAEVGYFPVGVRRGGDLHTWARIALRYRVAWSPVEGAVYHLSASNRACLVFPLPADVAPAAPIDGFLASGKQLISSRFYMEEYLVKLRLSDTAFHLLSGKKVWARELLCKTGATVLFRRRRHYLQIMLLLPPSLLRVKASIARGIQRFLAC